MEKSKLIIEKQVVECYKIRGEEFSWADITIDAKHNTGRISIASDYGNWQNFWGACGCSFNEFLAGIDIHYAANKFGAGNWFDLEKTIKGLKERINDSSVGEKYKKEIFEELEELSNSSGKEEFIHIVQNCDKIMEFENHCPDMINSIEPGFKRFWEEIWQFFITEISKVETAEK